MNSRTIATFLGGCATAFAVVALAASFPEAELENFDDGTPVEIIIPELPPELGTSLETEGKIIRTMPLADKDSQSCGVVVSLSIDHDLYDRLERYLALRRAAIIDQLGDAGSPSGAAGDEVVSE